MTNAAEQHRRDLTARINAKRAAFNEPDRPVKPTPCAAPDERWTVAQTSEGMEASTARRLRKLGFEVYLPRLIELRKDYRKHRGKRRVLLPLFSEYVFVKVSVAMRRWGEIMRTIGVEGVLMAGDVPAKLLDEFIEVLAARFKELYADDETPGAIVHANKPTVGDTVQIAEGPFKFWDAKVDNLDKFDSQGRIGLLLAVLGRSVRIEVDAGTVARL